MKNFALAVVVVAFGALMVAGCPGDNKASNKKADDNKVDTNAPVNADGNASK